MGAVETLRQDRCNVKQRDRVDLEYGSRISDVKPRGFQRSISAACAVEKHREFAEHCTGLSRPGDPTPSFTTATAPS